MEHIRAAGVAERSAGVVVGRVAGVPRDWKAMPKKGVEPAKEGRSGLGERGVIGGGHPSSVEAPPVDAVSAAGVPRHRPDHPDPFAQRV